MTQFKEKGGEQETVRAGLFTYPVLMAADILLYDADRVPVGDDQRQHLELTRDVAMRFNNRYGETFVVPEAAVPKVAARVMDLQEPTRKMSKSVSSPLGTVLVLDSPEEIDRKVRKAVTDTETEVRYDPAAKPGVSQPARAAGGGDGRRSRPSWPPATPTTAPLKADVAEALVELLRPVRERYAELHADPATSVSVLADGAAKAQGRGGAHPRPGHAGRRAARPPGGFSA